MGYPIPAPPRLCWQCFRVCGTPAKYLRRPPVAVGRKTGCISDFCMHSAVQRSDGWRGNDECKFLMQHADGCGALEGTYCKLAVGVWCSCLYLYLRRYKQLLLQHCWQRPIVHGQAARRHATLFFQQQRNGHATPLAAKRLKRPPSQVSVPKDRQGGPCWSRYPYLACTRWVPKRCYPPATHANALQEARAQRQRQWSAQGWSAIASAWAATTATATTRPEPFLALLRKHGGSTISAIPWLLFLFFNFFAPARLD